MAKYYMEEVFSLKYGGYEDDEEVKQVFSDYEYIETTDVWHSDRTRK